MATKVKLGTDAQWGVKENGLLGFNDENGVFKAIELSSSRASGATYVAQSGLIADAEVGVPRIDWTNGVGELLLEPQRRNICLQSEDFTTTWSVGRSSVSSNVATAPDGSTTADALVANTTANDHFVTQAITTSASEHNFSCFVKQGGKSWVRLWETGVNVYVDFDVANGVVGTTSGTIINSSITDYGNGWYRCSFSYDDTIGGSRSFRIYALEGDNDRTYAGDNVTEELYLWGCQVEDGGSGIDADYATSYIRTEGSSVTRIADAVSGNSSLGQVINSSEGVLYFEGSGLSPSIGNKVISINDGSNTNAFWLYIISNSSGIRIFDGNTIGSFFGGTAYENTKYALVYNSTNTRLFVNGALAITIPFKSMSNLNTLSFSDGSGSQIFEGKVKDLRVYDTALSDSELETLTTL